MKRYLLSVILGLVFQYAWSQNSYCKQKVGFFASRNIEKLSRKLSKGLTTDSQKVCAIHYWITHNIKYDSKKFIQNDYKVVSKNKILRKRKAICYGYADLFNTLCQMADIPSVIVTGYSKNKAVDICDSFYLEDHAWNAVRINENWYLIDATWNAGYIRYWRPTLWGYVLKAVTLGKTTQFRFKPKFKKRTSNEYYLRTGNHFNYDHHAANPIWQILDSFTTIQQFFLDSAYYYGNPKDYRTIPSQKYNAQRNSYYSLNDTQKLYQDADAFLDFNYRNPYLKGRSYFIKNVPLVRQLNKKSKDTIYQLNLCDSIIQAAQKGKKYADSTQYLLKQELKSKLRNLKVKNGILRSQNKILIKASNLKYKQAQKGLIFNKRNKSYTKSCVRQNRIRYQSLKRNNAFKTVKVPRKSNASDSIKLMIKLGLLEQSIAQLDSIQKSNLANADSLFRLSKSKLERSLYYEKNKKQSNEACLIERIFGSDNFDYQLKSAKDTIMAHQLLHDSDLFMHNLLVFDSITHYIKLNYKLNLQYAKLYRQKAVLYRKLKGKCKYYQYASEYENNLKSYYSNMAQFNAWINFQKDNYSTLKGNKKKLKKQAKKTIVILKKELKLVQSASMIKNRNSALQYFNNRNAKQIKKQVNAALKVKRKLSPKKP